jgi:peptide/nickel transport system permease protein
MSANDRPFEEAIDWDSIEDSRGFPPRVWALTVGLGFLGALYGYHRYVVDVYLVFEWKLGWFDWLFLLSVVFFVAYVVVPAIQRPRFVARIWARFRRQRGAVVALGFLLLVVAMGVFGPVVRSTSHNLTHALNPPLFASVEIYQVTECAGRVRDVRCYGSLQYPLGTDQFGRDVLGMLFQGARVTTYIGFVTAMFVVPLATAVGLLAGYRGGIVDDVVGAAIDIQQTLPALIVYILLVSLLSRSLWLLVLVFGIFGWGTVARLVRSETKQRAQTGYVLAAKSEGASAAHIARRHLLPNVTNTVVMAMAHLIPLLVLIEAGVAYVGFSNPGFDSWGRTIALGVDPDYTPIWEQWWVATWPALFLSGTVLACKLVGDALRDALDPR